MPQANPYYQQQHQHARTATLARPSHSRTSSPVVQHAPLSSTSGAFTHAFVPSANLHAATLPLGNPLGMLPSQSSSYPTPAVLTSPAPLPPVPLHAPAPLVAPAPSLAATPRAQQYVSSVPASAPPPPADPEVRTRRAIVACRFCRSRKLRCDGEERCRQCARRGEECVYTLPPAAQRRADGKSEAAAAAAAASGSSGSVSGSTASATPSQAKVARKTNEGGKITEKASNAGRAAKRRGGPDVAGPEGQSADKSAGSKNSEASTKQILSLPRAGASAARTASPASSRISQDIGSLGRAASSLRHTSQSATQSSTLHAAFATSQSGAKGTQSPNDAGPSTTRARLPFDARAASEATLRSPATPRYAAAASDSCTGESRPFPSVLYLQGERPVAHQTLPASPSGLAAALDGTEALSWPPRNQQLAPSLAAQQHPPPPPPPSRGASFPPHSTPGSRASPDLTER